MDEGELPPSQDPGSCSSGSGSWRGPLLLFLDPSLRDTPVTPVVYYLLTELAGCSVDLRISWGVCKLAWTSWLYIKKKGWSEAQIKGLKSCRTPIIFKESSDIVILEQPKQEIDN